MANKKKPDNPNRFTPLTYKLYQFVLNYHEKYNYSPVFNEIVTGCAMSRGAVELNLKKLVEGGYLERPRRGVLRATDKKPDFSGMRWL